MYRIPWRPSIWPGNGFPNVFILSRRWHYAVQSLFYLMIIWWTCHNAATTCSASFSKFVSLNFLNGRGMPTSDRTVLSPALTSNVPFLGFSPLITTFPAPSSSNNNFSFVAERLNTPQLLQASMVTAVLLVIFGSASFFIGDFVLAVTFFPFWEVPCIHWRIS